MCMHNINSDYLTDSYDMSVKSNEQITFLYSSFNLTLTSNKLGKQMNGCESWRKKQISFMYVLTKWNECEIGKIPKKGTKCRKMEEKHFCIGFKHRRHSLNYRHFTSSLLCFYILHVSI